MAANSLILDEWFGTGIILGVGIQIGFGWYHHRRYVRDKPSHRRWFTHVHLWLGRTLILCGIANCGFGMLLAGVGIHWVIIFWAICGGLAVCYFFAYVILRFCQRRMKRMTKGQAEYGLEDFPRGGGARSDAYAGPGGVYVPLDSTQVVSEGFTRYGSSERLTVSAAPAPYDPPRQFDEPAEGPYSTPPGSRAGQRHELHL
jgi:hypothetical protein